MSRFFRVGGAKIAFNVSTGPFLAKKKRLLVKVSKYVNLLLIWHTFGSKKYRPGFKTSSTEPTVQSINGFVFTFLKKKKTDQPNNS